jgi:hypothetical protein
MPSTIDAYIKAFLTEMHNFFDVFRSGSESKLLWSGKANPTSMLNLYHMLLLFSSLRNIWDGNHKNYVCFIKSFLGNISEIVLVHYFGVKLDQIHLLQSLNKGLMEKFIQESPEILDLHSHSKKYEWYPGFQIYPNIHVQILLEHLFTVLVTTPCHSQAHELSILGFYSLTSSVWLKFNIISYYMLPALRVENYTEWCWPLLQDWAPDHFLFETPGVFLFCFSIVR